MSQDNENNKKVKMDDEKKEEEKEKDVQILVFCVGPEFFADGYTKLASEVTEDEQLILDAMISDKNKMATVFTDLFYVLFVDKQTENISVTQHDMVLKIIPHFTIEYLMNMRNNHTWKRQKPLDFNSKNVKIYMQMMFD